MHWPAQGGKPPWAEGVQGTVGVQVEPVAQGPLLPTVQEVTGLKVEVVLGEQYPPQGMLLTAVLSQPAKTLQVQPVGQGALLPEVQGYREGWHSPVHDVVVKQP